ncbi:hypothetical protein E4T39_05028 [Aureobasidium subglaciale]|nr:hypothetical protein E4T39_05028 [Aureobasidium subglaciale]
MTTIHDSEFMDLGLENQYYPTFVVNKSTNAPSMQDSAYSSPRPSSSWLSSEYMSDSCSGTWSSPPPSIAYSPSPKPLDYRSHYPDWSHTASGHFTSLNQVQMPPGTLTYCQSEVVYQPCYQTQNMQPQVPDTQPLIGVGDWTLSGYQQVMPEPPMESSPAPSSTIAPSDVSSSASPKRRGRPLIKQEGPTEHHHTCLASVTRRSNNKPTTAYPCPFLPYGCPSTFSSKNEWKRHLNTQHLSLSTYRCDLCIPNPSSSTSPQQSNDFNRKDLFIQHLRHTKHSGFTSRTSSPLLYRATPTTDLFIMYLLHGYIFWL